MKGVFQQRIVAAGVAVFLAACGTTLQRVDPEATKVLLPWLDAQTTKSAVMDRLGRSWRYADSAQRILIYNMAPLKERAALSPRPPDDADSTHELVLVFDEQGRLKRHSLLKVR